MKKINTDHPKKEKTFVIIKPDGVQRTLIGEIIRRYERMGLKLPRNITLLIQNGSGR